jgi:tRNA-specific 2-thiouridylase
VYSEGGKVRVLLAGEGEYGVAAGQACVFYAETGPYARVLGGGWIAAALGRGDVSRGDAAAAPETGQSIGGDEDRA